MQFPDTEQTRDTNNIMLEVHGRFPEMPTFAYNRIFSALYKQLENGLTGDELASVVHASLNGDKDLKPYWLNTTRSTIQQYFREQQKDEAYLDSYMKKWSAQKGAR